MSDRGICRHSYLIAIGAGALLDPAGYAAAVAHRGIRHIRVWNAAKVAQASHCAGHVKLNPLSCYQT